MVINSWFLKNFWKLHINYISMTYFLFSVFKKKQFQQKVLTFCGLKVHLCRTFFFITEYKV